MVLFCCIEEKGQSHTVHLLVCYASKHTIFCPSGPLTSHFSCSSDLWCTIIIWPCKFFFTFTAHGGANESICKGSALHKCFHNFDDFCGGNSARKTQWCHFPNIWRSRFTCALPRGRSTPETNSHRHGERNTFRITLSDAVQNSAAEAGWEDSWGSEQVKHRVKRETTKSVIRAFSLHPSTHCCRSTECVGGKLEVDVSSVICCYG